LSRHLAFAAAILFVTSAAALKARVIYGDDNRVDYYDASLGEKHLADSTVALMRASVLSANGDVTQISSVPYGQQMSLCPNEPFYSQETAAFCSGFLVAPDVVVTAGHCISSAETCAQTRFVFGFRLDQPGTQPHEVPSAHVFSCKEVLHTVSEAKGQDFAVVRLDRPVDFVQPLAVRRSGVPAVGDPLEVMGYPEGLPLKLAAGANVRSVQDAFLVTNTDTYGGNSGSAVFSTVTGLVEGVLVRGELDFVFANGCRTSYKCPADGCRGEDVTLFSKVLPYIP
jgi:V8-like Glu-specific endopeptidase